jgi:hypothetical protein
MPELFARTSEECGIYSQGFSSDQKGVPTAVGIDCAVEDSPIGSALASFRHK